ncbi:MAG: ATP-dependent DNA helicase [Thermoplasmatota archaeon]
MAVLPYPPRPGQREFVADVQEAQENGGHLIVEAGTGTGKTVCALTACCTTTAKDGRRVVYATRTNSQQSQVAREHGKLVESGEPAGLLVPFMGRRHYCPLLRSDERFRDGTPEELGKLCRDAKAKAVEARTSGRPVQGACPYYGRLLNDGPGPVEALLAQGVLDGPAVAARVEAAGSCPYEALKLVLPKARVVVVPFIFLLEERLRASLLQWMGVGPDEVHLVVDEAHNLPDAACAHHSPRIGIQTLKRAQAEAEECKDPVLAGAHLTTTFLDQFARALVDLADEFVHGQNEDGLLPPGALPETLMGSLRVPSTTLTRIALELDHWGEVVREERRSRGLLPRSYLGSVGRFLGLWLQEDDRPTAPLVVGGAQPALELVLLDPAPVLGWLSEFWSVIQMSGTLAPLEAHRALCGVPDATLREYASPFAADHLHVFGWEGLHRSHDALERDPGIVERQQQIARRLLASWSGRTGIFFPSHALLNDYLEEGFLHGLGRPIFAERPEMSMAALVGLVESFKRESRPGPLLLGVLGGRLTEGIDFPGDAMEQILIMGVPYPKPGARVQARIHHFDHKSGDGWAVAVHNPVARVLRQGIGRLIRGPDDRGTAVVLDGRIVRFRAQIPRLEMVDDPEAVALHETPQPWQV